VYLFVFVLCIVCSVLPVSLDCLRPMYCVLSVASVSGLSSSCVLCAQCCQCLWIVFVLCIVCSMLPVSLDCLRPVYCVLSVASVSGLSIIDYPFNFLKRLLIVFDLIRPRPEPTICRTRGEQANHYANDAVII